MPPLRSGRASKACENCRRQKTRCYASESLNEACLRCGTLGQPCSLNDDPSPQILYLDRRQRRSPLSRASGAGAQRPAFVDERLERLENTVDALVQQIGARLDAISSPPTSHDQAPAGSRSSTSAEPTQAPVFLIRDVANDVGIHSPEEPSSQPHQYSDVITAGLVSLREAYELISLFRVHYGRWVKFDESLSTEALVLRVRKSPLLLCSICLIAVRHTSQNLASRLAPSLFAEAKSLVTSALLVVPQSVEFFQAALILSLWSTTIGQVPLSIDSWLLTGYALQQGLASPYFSEVLRIGPRSLSDRGSLDAWCIWNHICVAHLQYCVGTRRQALLNQAQVDRCLRFLTSDHLTNFEARMVAEVKLYWIVYEKCCGSHIDLTDTKATLQAWKQDWATLLDEPRAQFLQMGYNFAFLLAYCQFFKSATAAARMRGSVLAEMIQKCTAIINLAMDTADERTRHLTDHIYHIIAFSAITLCGLLHTYESKIRAAHHDVAALDKLVLRLVNWLRSIGLPCHAAHLLGDIVSAQHKKLRPNASPLEPISTYTDMTGRATTFLEHQQQQQQPDNQSLTHQPQQTLPNNMAYHFPNFIGSELWDIGGDAQLWPQWDQIISDTDMSV